MSFCVVIPARFASTRLPGKVLLDLAGEPMLAHVHRRALESGADGVWVATDDRRVLEAAVAAGAEAEMTDSAHASGTDRMAELAARRGWNDDEVVVNLQGDEPLMPGSLIAQVAEALAADTAADIATACVSLESMDEYRDPNVVKVVRDERRHALYFSRAAIPHRRDGNGLPQAGALRHLGIYAYRVGALKRFASADPTALERSEALEQLRALSLGLSIHVVEAAALPGPGVDTEDDLAQVAKRLQASDHKETD